MVWTTDLRQLQSIQPSIIVEPNRVLWTVFTPGISCQINQSEGAAPSSKSDLHCSIFRVSVTWGGNQQQRLDCLPSLPHIPPQTDYKNRAGRRQSMFLESLLDLSIPRNISLQHEQSRQSEASQLGTILSTTSSIQTNPGRTSRRFGPAPATNTTTPISRLPRAKCSPWRIFLRMMIRNYKHQARLSPLLLNADAITDWEGFFPPIF